jgi:hypothetical protein
MSFERHVRPAEPNTSPTVDRLVAEIIDTPGSRRLNETTYSYPDVSKTGEIDEERFRLTAYDMPEPEGVVWEKPRRWLPYWLAGSGVLLILGATWILRRSRKREPVGV